MQLSELDKRIINRWQGGFPLTESPYQFMAEELETDEATLLDRLEKLLGQGILSRFGPMYNIEKLGGEFCLAAMSVPDELFSKVTDKVNRHTEVAHNYQRDHYLNMWFVIAAENPDYIDKLAKDIEQETGLQVYLFPKQQEFFVELKLKV